MTNRLKLLPLLCMGAFAYAEETHEGHLQEEYLEDITVTTFAPTAEPNRVVINPKNPFQPIPAADGAGLLKTVPNMNVIRKGGMSGDPVLRGLGGSRLTVTANDSFLYGGCGGRMDPPTAYIFPEKYDQVVITKGPQSVSQGAGLIAGSVRFVRNPFYFAEKGIRGNAALTAGSFGRFDAAGDITAGMPLGYLHLDAAYNRAKDYKDGGGDEVHSAYRRRGGGFAVGLTPTPNTVFEAGYDISRGWAAYADRMMDGHKFDREAWHLLAQHKNITPWFTRAKIEYGHSYVDHVMDNYHHRRVMKPMYSVGNPDRKTDTLRAETEFTFRNNTTLLGIDYMKDEHRSRMSGMQPSRALADAYSSKPRNFNQDFRNWGIFAENNWQINDNHSLIAGLRYDRTRARFANTKKVMGESLNNPADAARYNAEIQDNLSKDYNMTAGFARYEYAVGSTTWYAGLGVAQRSPDFWERNKIRGWAVDKETNTQIDAGAIYRGNRINASAGIFAGRINDFILLEKIDKEDTARNISAQRYGFEADVHWQFARDWKVGTNLAYTYGKNRTDGRALAQTPPFEANTYLGYDNGTQSATLLMRNVAAQKRFARGQGNIVGKDSRASAGFTVVSLNGNWRLGKNFSVSAGVDNIFDKKYREFINKSAGAVAGYNAENGVQLYEPGRQIWAKLQAKF